MVKGYVLSEGDRAAVRRVVAKVGDTPLSGAALKSRHRPEADADYSYSGYFKIVDASTTGNGTTTHKIRVVDGATYDPETGSSGPKISSVIAGLSSSGSSISVGATYRCRTSNSPPHSTRPEAPIIPASRAVARSETIRG